MKTRSTKLGALIESIKLQKMEEREEEDEDENDEDGFGEVSHDDDPIAVDLAVKVVVAFP
jgi:hypothetical protein